MRNQGRTTNNLYRQPRRYGKRNDFRQGDGVAENSVAWTALQTTICVALLAIVFTMQFVNPVLFEKTGNFLLTVMGEENSQTVEVGIFDMPITKDTIRGYLSGEVVKFAYAAENDVWIPSNLHCGGVLLTAKMRYPAYGTVSSLFGLREHPISGKSDFHTGIDIAAPAASDIFAVLPGKVVETGWSDSYGNYLKLQHSEQLETVYCHCLELLAEEGMILRAGERVALVGSTGISTGPHLHFEVHVNGSYADPLLFFKL